MHARLLAVATSVALAAPALAQQGISEGAVGRRDRTPAQAPAADVPDWVALEAPVLTNHVQLTFPDRFDKAGESYFSPDGRRIIFQGVEVAPESEGDAPQEGAAPTFYAMYVADLVRDDDGRVTGIDGIRRISPEGSSNTCGWFHPTRLNTVIFGSTLVAPAAPNAVGFRRGGSPYMWQFPPEMTIVQCDLGLADGTAATLEPLREDPAAYLAECSFTTDGRHLLFCKCLDVDAPTGKGGDILVWDRLEDREVSLVAHQGYDGGPFFSPDERWICYRSDRSLDDHLQIYVAELARDERGTITGIAAEHPITKNAFVNWAPFWHPDGRFLLYTTSEQGHRNYEVYLVDVEARVSGGPAAPDSAWRITHADRFDGLPAFDATGRIMMWTSQRDGSGTSQLWLADFAMPAAAAPPAEGAQP